MKTTLAVMLLLTLTAVSQRREYIAQTKRIDDYRVSITCTNNADPTGYKLDHNMIVVTCRDERGR
jgi:hypothetical protein